ncbi:MAG: DUF4834 family protein [Rikenellaceae bacterium]
MFDFIKDNPIIFLLIFLAIVAPTFFLGAMQVIFYIIAGIILLIFILGLVFKYKIRQFQKNMESQMGGGEQQQQGGFYNFGQQNGGRQRRATNDDGDVKIFKQKGVGEKKVSKNVGDYVDFEEVKEND